MLFNSFAFLLFLPIVFLLYWFVFNKNIKYQNLFVVCISYLFYGWWDWRFLSLIAFTSFCSWLSGILIFRKRQGKEDDSDSVRKYCRWIVGVNIFLNLFILGYFKYADFFISNFLVLLRNWGIEALSPTLSILLPVGISFYTFQALSYSIDVYKRKLEPTKDIVAFFAFVSFFPQLVAGPIERATQLLPQFYTSRTFNYAEAVDGLRQILWGFFKKVVVADNCALVANAVFSNVDTAQPSALVLGALMFTFQIYGDFSGYSDIAVGTAHLFNIKLMRNFNVPYFSRDIAEFWRRWHISLNTWFRDYIYIPLGGSRCGKWVSIRNTMIIFVVSGLWHGANWTYVAWGVFHGLLFLPLLLLKKNRVYTDIVAKGRVLPSLADCVRMLSTFSLVVIGWVIFRAIDIHQAWVYLSRMCSPAIIGNPRLDMLGLGSSILLGCFVFIIIMLGVEWVQRGRRHGLDLVWISSSSIRRSIYLGIAWIIFFFMGVQETFIYFQF